MSLSEEIEKKALEPAEYESDGERIKQRTAAEIIALLKYSKKSRVTAKRAFGAIGVAQISTPGSSE